MGQTTKSKITRRYSFMTWVVAFIFFLVIPIASAIASFISVYRIYDFLELAFGAVITFGIWVLVTLLSIQIGKNIIMFIKSKYRSKLSSL